MKFLKLFGIVLIVIIVVIVIYLSFKYFRLKEEKQEFDMRAKQAEIQLELDKINNATSQQEENKKSNLECTKTVYMASLETWNKNCKSRGLGDNCSLPVAVKDSLEKETKDTLDQCNKMFPIK